MHFVLAGEAGEGEVVAVPGKVEVAVHAVDLVDVTKVEEAGAADGEADGVAGKFNILFGRDEILLAGLSLGATGAVGSTYNYAAPLYHRIIDAFNRGDLEAARRDQARAIEFIGALDRHGGLVAGKVAMKLIGLDCGPVRLPLRAATAADEAGLRAAFEKVGFFDYCSKLP